MDATMIATILASIASSLLVVGIVMFRVAWSWGKSFQDLAGVKGSVDKIEKKVDSLCEMSTETKVRLSVIETRLNGVTGYGEKG